MARKHRESKFVKDLVIAADDGHMYYIKESDWRSSAHRFELTDFKPETQDLILSGVALAAVPEKEDDLKAVDTSGPDPLGFCYIVGLASLREKTIFQRKAEHAEAQNEAVTPKS